MKNDRPKENEKEKYKDLNFLREIILKEKAIRCSVECKSYESGFTLGDRSAVSLGLRRGLRRLSHRQ